MSHTSRIENQDCLLKKKGNRKMTPNEYGIFPKGDCTGKYNIWWDQHMGQHGEISVNVKTTRIISDFCNSYKKNSQSEFVSEFNSTGNIARCSTQKSQTKIYFSSSVGRTTFSIKKEVTMFQRKNQ